jgi:hypothetical protein
MFLIKTINGKRYWTSEYNNSDLTFISFERATKKGNQNVLINRSQVSEIIRLNNKEKVIDKGSSK